ncbi:hypothetical protein RFI_30476, partial [Reticulomyxa filosa]
QKASANRTSKMLMPEELNGDELYAGTMSVFVEKTERTTPGLVMGTSLTESRGMRDIPVKYMANNVPTQTFAISEAIDGKGMTQSVVLPQDNMDDHPTVRFDTREMQLTDPQFPISHSLPSSSVVAAAAAAGGTTTIAPSNRITPPNALPTLPNDTSLVPMYNFGQPNVPNQFIDIRAVEKQGTQQQMGNV